MIEILHYEKANKNKTIGYVDIKLTLKDISMIIRKIPHLQSGDRKWFNLPMFGRDRPDGTAQFLRYWQFELDVHNSQLLEALGEKVKNYCIAHDIQDVKLLDLDSEFIEPAEMMPF